jgi:hypothetical protein
MTCKLIVWRHPEEERWREMDRIMFRGMQRVDLMQEVNKTGQDHI